MYIFLTHIFLVFHNVRFFLNGNFIVVIFKDSLKIFNFSLLRNRQEIHITLSLFSFSLFFFIWCIACVPKNGPEGGRSSTPDILPTGKKMARDPSASAPQHRSFPLYYSNDDRRFLHIPDIRHMWLFQTPVTWCHLCVGHICSLLHWF